MYDARSDKVDREYYTDIGKYFICPSQLLLFCCLYIFELIYFTYANKYNGRNQYFILIFSVFS